MDIQTVISYLLPILYTGQADILIVLIIVWQYWHEKDNFDHYKYNQVRFAKKENCRESQVVAQE